MTARQVSKRPSRLTPGAKVLLAGVVVGTVFVAGTVAVAAAAIYSGGSISVDVEEGDAGGLSISVPAGLAHLAIALVPSWVIDRAGDEVRDELDPWIPAVRQAWRALEEAPDFVLVEVSSPREHVRVEKRGRQLVVLVEDGRDRVRVTLPLKTVDRIVAKL